MLNEDKGYRGGLVAQILRGTTTCMTTARTIYKPRGKIYHNSTRTRNIATTMDMLMILTSEDFLTTRHYTTIVECFTRDVASMCNSQGYKVGELATYLNILDVDIVDYSISTIETHCSLRYINIPTECNFR